MKAQALAFVTVIALFLCDSAFAASQSGALHAQPWVFGQSMDRNNDLWRKGVNGEAISRKNRNKAPAADDTGVAERDHTKTGPKGSLGLGMRREASTWSVDPARRDLRPDEGMTRERRNVVGAYAGIQTDNDFNINFGPELILKDEEHSAEGAAGDQPDSALGLGMKFKYDF